MTVNRLSILLVLFVCAPLAQGQEYVPLWPEGLMPNSKGMTITDSIANERIVRVGKPGMWVFLPAAQENRKGAVVILPGGGYQRLAYQGSGLQLAKWLNTFGVSAFVVSYRLPNSPDLIDRTIGPLQDAQRAMRLVRANALRWGIDPSKVGALGTSAGGHLAATLGTFTDDVSAVADSISRCPYRPDFLILVSPVIDLGTYAHTGSRDNLLGPAPSRDMIERFSAHRRVSSWTPPVFMVHAENDKSVPLRNSLLFHQSLVDHNVSASLHVFPQGGHAIALRNNPGSTQLWTDLCEAWLREMGFVAAE